MLDHGCTDPCITDHLGINLTEMSTLGYKFPYWEGVLVNAKIGIYILICETVNCAFKIQLVNLQQA